MAQFVYTNVENALLQCWVQVWVLPYFPRVAKQYHRNLALHDSADQDTDLVDEVVEFLYSGVYSWYWRHNPYQAVFVGLDIFGNA